MDLRIKDILADGTALAVAGERGKTRSAARIVPLHEHAQAVIRQRLASIPTEDPEAPLWPEVPATGRDKRRAKVISTRYPAIRTRILGPSHEVDLHSFRRTFLTAAETAMHRGARLNAELIALLAGHQRGALAFDLYSDWARMGRQRELKGALRERLGTLQAAVDDLVQMGFEGCALAELETTRENRPQLARVTPAFRRHSSLGPL